MTNGTRIGGSARLAHRWPAILATYGDILPSFPGPDALRLAKKPSPPMLVRGAGDPEHARVMGRAYRTVITSLYGRTPTEKVDGGKQRRAAFSVIKGAAILQHPEYPTLCNAAGLLVRYTISPLAWVAYSYGGWVAIRAHNRRLPLYPTVKWVYSMKRLEERQLYFAWHEGFHQGSLVDLAEEHRELVVLYSKMRAALLREKTLTTAQVQKHVDAFLPRREYARLARAAQAKYDARRDEYQDQLDRGDYIW